MTFMEDAKGNKYDVAGNIIPPADEAIKNALTTARAETYNPYAEEIASAKKLMADQAYQNQGWGDWASDAGRSLYETGKSFLPTALGGRGEVGLTDIAKGVYESGKSAATLPGDVLTGKTKVFDPASGNLTDEVMGRGMDFTGFMTLGAGAIPAEANALRMGMDGPPRRREAPEIPDAGVEPAAPTAEEMALKAAQEATGEDEAAIAAKTAGQQLADDQMGAMQPPSMPANVSPDAPTKAFVQFGKPIPPSAPPPDPKLVASAQADTRMGADIVKRRLPVIVPEQERVIGGVYTPGAPDGRRWSELTPQELSVRGKGAGFTDNDLQNIWNQTLAEVSEAGRQAVANTGATWKAFPTEKWDKAFKLPLRSQLWYELSGEAFVDRLPDLKYNEHMMFLDLVGATSARARPGENLERALAVLSQRLRGVPIDVDLTTPSTVNAALRRDGKNVSSDLANKTGMFSDTLALTGGLPTRYPISVNDVWVGNAFGITDDQLSANQALHEVFGKYTNKLRDLVNKTSPSQYPHQSWNLQSRQWVQLRAAKEGVDTSVGTAVEGSDYAGEWDNAIQKLQDAGIDVLDRKITRDVLMDPRFADALRSTTPGFRSAPKATIEFGTLLTPNGQKAADIYNRARQIGDQKTQDEYLGALTTSMYHTARGKTTIWDETVRTALGKAVDVTRIYSPKQEDPFAISGTFGGAAAPNIRVPLRNLTPDQVAYFNAVAGKGLRQKAMAAVEINRLEAGQPIPEGAVLSRAVQFEYDGPIPQKMLTDFAAALGEGFEVSAVRYPDSMVVDINPRFGDAGPEAPSVKAVDDAIKSIRKTYGIENPKVFDISYKSEYGKNYVEDPGDGSGYRQIINATLKGWEAEAVAQLRQITGGKVSDAVLKKYLKGDDEAFKSAAAKGGFGVSGYTGRANTVRENLRKRLGDHADITKKWNAIGKEIDNELGALIPKWERRYTKAEKKSIKETPQRAEEQGFTTEAYRGSNRDIQEYGPSASETGYYGGKPTYFTNSPEDATFYTRVPVEEFEVTPYNQLKILQETNPNATLQDVLGEQGTDLAYEHVNRILGGQNLGTIYPSKLRMQNPVRVGGEGETVFQGPKADDIVKITAETLAERGIPEKVSTSILSKLDEMLQADGFGAMEFDIAVRTAARSADRQMTNKIGSVLTDIYQKAGFDSIDLDASVFGDGRSGGGGYYSYRVAPGTRHYLIFDPENIRGRFAKFGGIGPEGPAYMKAMGGAVDEEDIDNALRIARATGGRTSYAEAGSVPVMMEDAKGNKYDAQGNVIPPTNPGPNPQRSDMTPEQVGRQAAQDPATYDALMERYAIPDRDIAEYEALKATVGQQPQDIRQMTHVGDRPRREMKINMPLLGGEYSMGTAPYDVAEGLQGMAQGAYDFKTMPAYFFPPTAPFAFGADVLESRIKDDPLGLALNLALTPQGFSTAKSAVDLARRNSKATAAAVGAGAYLSPDEAQAGPERWFSKAIEFARAIPMEKMTGQQALAMLRKGVSPEELRWTGADVFLSTTPKISKEELIDYLKNNRFQTEDVTLGGSKPTRREDVRPSETARASFMEDWNILKDKRKALDEEFYKLSPDEQAAQMNDYWGRQFQLDTARDALKSKMVDATIEEMGGLGLPVQYGPGSRFGDQYVTRGGEGYGEDLYKMPNSMKIYNSYVKQLKEKYGESALNDMPLTVSERGTLDNLMEAAGDERKVYTSTHFPQYPGYLAHTRSQMLNVEPPGANRPYKAWNMEEAQSDLAKSGRKSGFYDPVVYQQWVNDYYKNEKIIEQARDQLQIAAERAEEGLGPEPNFDVSNFYNKKMNSNFNKWHEMRQDALNNDPSIVEARKKLNDAIARGRELEAAMPNTQAAPIGPFVKSMEGWSKLAIKKQLDKALDGGADYFTWTPGEAQAERYSLSKVADNITYNAPFVAPSGKSYPGRLVATKNGSQVFAKEGVTPEKLPEFIGKELADKINANKTIVEEGPMKGWEKSAISGDELKFGGEGMRKYYDSAFVKYVQDVFQEATGKKPKVEIIEAQTADGPRKQLGIRLDDEMRETARFSDFNKGGRVASPVVNKALELTRDY